MSVTILMMNITKKRHFERLTGVLLLLLPFTAGAQTPLGFKQFSRHVDDKIELPYQGKQLWLFKKDSLWGLYDEEAEQQLVPPDYDMVLPGIESVFYYVIRDHFVGFYALNGGEIIAPNEFEQLQLVVDTSGVYFLQHVKDITKQDKYYTTHTTETRSFELFQDDQSLWASREVSAPPLIRDNSRVKIHDGVKRIQEDQWIHQHAYLQKADDKGWWGSPINFLKVADQQSSVVAIQEKRYLIPTEYAEITWQTDYFQAKSYTSDNPINPLGYAAVESIFTTDFQWIASPPAGHAGLIMGGGYYTHDMAGTTVTLYDSLGKQLFTIDDFEGYPQEVLAVGDKYYLACCPENVEEEEMRVFRQSIYNREGQRQKTSKFRFEEIDEDKGLAIASVLSPEVGSFELNYGVYDLKQNEFMIRPEYEQLVHIAFENSLVEVPDPGCDSYFSGTLNETSFFWDCRGKRFAAQADFVSGQGYVVEVLEKPEVNSDSSSVTHIIEDAFNDLTAGDIGYYHASIEDTYRGLIIYRCIHAYNKEAVYFALGDHSQLILAPGFTSIHFQKDNETVHLEYEDQTYVFPISRYEK